MSMAVPTHIAIIPDGNRRWARERGLPGFEGHRYAANKILPTLIEKSGEFGVKYFTFWASSTENLKKRTKGEVKHLFNLARFFIQHKIRELKERGAQIKFIGDISKLPKDVQKGIKKSIQETSQNRKIIVIFAVNYGGKDEILRAIKKIQNSKVKSQNLNKSNFDKFLDTKGIPDPDLIIRTGGEKRLSGFMPWQSEYSELYFSDLYFPDFNANELEIAIEDYSLRQRRFGK